MVRRSVFGRVLALALLVGVAGVAVQGADVLPANAAFASQLTRYPYLTDVTQGYATVNWATDISASKGSITYGKFGSESCTAHKVSGSKTGISVKGVSEYQWKAKISGLQANSLYCYRVFLGTTDLLTSATQSPQFWSQIPAGNTAPYSFAVFGDWGDTDANGANPAQTALMTSMGTSGVRFALGTGDTAYDGGTQGNYGDLNQTGYRVSSVFGPNYWAKAGSTVPLFNVPGNHGGNATFFTNWPQDRVVAASSGKYAMETYCCANGAASQKSPSAWYAFDAGVARIYVLTAMWSDTNTGTSTDYGMDYAYRWQQSSAEYQWLQNDLQSHPSQLKFAVFHYPLYSDNATEPSDTFLQGANSLEGLLEQNGVNMVFNGHAHLYQHNAAPPGGVVSYISGGGGATPEPITKCKALDTYGLGWSTSGGGSSCGTAVKPTDINQVYHYLKVDVNGAQVTVSGVNALGQTFDSTTYDFAADTTAPTPPSNLQATAPSANRVDLTWGASSDPKGIAAYDIYRNGDTSPLATVNGTTTTFSDTTVAQQTQYSYVVKARDPSNNVSDPSNTATVTTPSSDGQAPTAPSNLAAVAPSATRVDLTWTASTDNSGVIDKYDIYRNGSVSPIATVNGSLTSYSDLTVSASTPYSYTVRARDASGNTSGDSNVAQVTTPSLGVLFADDFESGTLAAWTTVNGLNVAQGVTGGGGQWVARETSASAGATYAFKTISPTQTELYAKFRFQVVSRTGSVDLMRFRNATGGSKFSLYVSGTSGTLSTRNAAGTSTRSAGPTIVNGQWYTVEVHAKIASPTVTEVWLDGVHLTELDATGDLGSTAIGQFLIGTTATGTYDVVLDDVAVAKNFI